MEQYIKKSDIVAEIEKRLKVLNNDRDFIYLQIKELEALLSFLNTLEVKEVGLDLGSPDGDMSVKTVWDGDKIVSSKAQKGE